MHLTLRSPDPAGGGRASQPQLQPGHASRVPAGSTAARAHNPGRPRSSRAAARLPVFCQQRIISWLASPQRCVTLLQARSGCCCVTTRLSIAAAQLLNSQSFVISGSSPGSPRHEGAPGMEHGQIASARCTVPPAATAQHVAPAGVCYGLEEGFPCPQVACACPISPICARTKPTCGHWIAKRKVLADVALCALQKLQTFW